KDQGRFEATHSEADKMMFKVPGLRNIEKTAPYFHDGSAANLEDAIQIMSSHQLGRELKPEQVKLIAAFLRTLTGELPTAQIQNPELPKSGPATPKPNPT
ncbi:MAG TPA: cytochrome-c peroxidase, partial [Polyangiaceae bacterium]|nr:cytochrome-c peroxidase [Polyangiaceae bacterium]